MRIIGLTGGIASGKSFVAELLEKLGAAVVDADVVYHELLAQKELREKISQEFGTDFFLPDGSLDRKKLGKLVFSDKSALSRLNDITHPAVRAELFARLKTFSERQPPPKLAVVVVPLLYEVGWDEHVEAVVVVSVDDKTQIERLMNRNGWSRDEALARIGSQMPLAEKVKRADYVVDNSGQRDKTEKLIKEVYEKLTA